jgi:hypothetical protein
MSFVKQMAQKRKSFTISYKLKAIKGAETHYKQPARHCVCSCLQPGDSTVLYAGLVLKPGLESSEEMEAGLY